MTDPTPCIDESTILEFVQGALAPEGAKMVEAHLARCAECRAVVSELARSSLVARPAALAQPVPAATTQRQYQDLVLGQTVASEPPVRADGPTQLAPASDPRSVPIPGQVLAGKYLVERVIGQGGMGVVLCAKHVHLGQRVALKFLSREACKTQEAAARFLREARAAVQIQGEHVARVTDVGMLENGAPYMVMELLRGADLGEVLRTRGPLGVAEACDYVLQACEALAEAHVLGIVHRDIKPQNLFLTQRPDGSPLVKVLDFGISKTPIGGSLFEGNLTSGEVMMGSPKYMSPEQMRSTRDVDARTDVWALGVVLYELLAGAPPFHADTMAGLAAAIQTMPPTALRFVRTDVPVDLERAIFKCLEKQAHDRTQNVGMLAEALRPFAPAHAGVSIDRISRMMRGGRADARIQSVPPGPGAPPPGAVTAEGLVGTNPGERRSSSAWLVWGIAAVLALVGGAGTFLYVMGREKLANGAGGVDGATATAVTTPTATATAAATAPGSSAPPLIVGSAADPSQGSGVRPTTATTTTTTTTTTITTAIAIRPRAKPPASVPPSAPTAPSSTSDVSRNGLLDRK